MSTKSSLLTVALVVLALSLCTAAIAQAQADLSITHRHFNSMDPLLSPSADGQRGEATYIRPPSPICSNPTSPDFNVNTDCEVFGPHNETTIAINPTNPLNIIGSANDYQLRLDSGGNVYEIVFCRAHVSFDGGDTWTTYPIYYHGYSHTGDPSVAFDASGRAYLAIVGLIDSHNVSGIGAQTSPDVLVATSSDGGKTWTTPTRVASGTGNSTSPGVFNDKEFLTAWGDGNAIVTWTHFNQGKGGSYINAPIFASVTHDGGQTWTEGIEISGAASFCEGAQGGNACDQDQASIPVMAADGSIFVGFLNHSFGQDGRDQYLVVKVDPETGERVAGPYKVADLIDGSSDYPVNIDGDQTYQDSQFRTWAAGNIAADPTNPNHLAVIWSDMRNSTLPAPADPYTAKTNSDIVVSQSFDGGATWSAPVALLRSGDQFMPWGAYDSAGHLRIGFFDRSYDPDNHKYGYTLATEKSHGGLSFNFAQMTDVLSNPTQGTRWFGGRTPNPAFPHPTTFLGDYSAIATAGSGAFGFWTDLRNSVTFGVRSGTGQDAYFGAQ